MPPFTPKEICRFFFWIAVLGVAIGMMYWFVFYSPGHEPIHLRRGSQLAHRHLTRSA